MTGPADFRDVLQLMAIGCSLEIRVERRSGSDWILCLPWDTGRACRLLANHPDRHVHVPDWCLPDFDVVEGRSKVRELVDGKFRVRDVFVIPILPPSPAGEGGAHDAGVGLTEVLRALVDAGCPPRSQGPGQWRSICPICRHRQRYDRRLWVSTMARIVHGLQDRFTPTIKCWGGCTRSELLAALGLVTERPVLTTRDKIRWRVEHGAA